MLGLVVPEQGGEEPGRAGRHGQAEAGAERPGHGRPERAGRGHRCDFVRLGHQGERLRCLLCDRMPVLCLGHLSVLDTKERADALCSVLYVGEYRIYWKHSLSYGTNEAIEKDV